MNALETLANDKNINRQFANLIKPRKPRAEAHKEIQDAIKGIVSAAGKKWQEK